MDLDVKQLRREDVFEQVLKFLDHYEFKVNSSDINRPWGGFLVIEEEQAVKFANQFFPSMPTEGLNLKDKLSPKLLIVAPNKRLSWQYHHRRAEIWKVIAGQAGVVKSEDDTEGKVKVLSLGDHIKLHQGERHRLIGLDDWAVIAELWQHTDADNPSDENDIVRIQDDFGR